MNLLSEGAEEARRGSDGSAERLSRSYRESISAADASGAEKVALATLSEGFSVAALYQRVIAPAMWRVGAEWEQGAISVADEHIATALTHQVMAAIYGLNLGHKRMPGRLLFAGLEGERHVLGLRMAADVIELAGYETIFLGADVPLDDLLQTVGARGPDLVLLSATMPAAGAALEGSIGAIQRLDPELVVLYGGQGARPFPDNPQAVFVEDFERLLGAVRSALGGSVSSAKSMPGPGAASTGRAATTVPGPKGRSSAEMESGNDSVQQGLSGVTADTADLARAFARQASTYKDLAYTDVLSGLPNRRAFEDRAIQLMDSAEAKPVAVLMMDLDRFKRVNDSHGHGAGDRVLALMSQTISERLRDGDFSARFGGDEFAALLPRTSLKEAGAVAERIREAVAEAGSEDSVTMSIGIAMLEDDIRGALLQADVALYEAKRGGRNAVGLGSRAAESSELVAPAGLDPTAEPADVHILVTDDRPEVRKLVESALGDQFDSQFATSVRQAHERLVAGSFQIALCHLDGADESGLDLVAEIVRGFPSTALVVLVTGEDDPEAAKRAFDLGAYGYLVEPFLPGQLLITVLSTLRRRQLEIAAKARSQNLEDKRQTIIDMVPVGIYAKDKSGRYIVSNKMADELAGLKPGELIGMTDGAFMPAEQLRLGPESDRQVFEGGPVQEREDSVLLAGGVEKTFKTIRFPLFGEEGEVTAAAGISVDISDEREAIRLRDELADAQREAIEELQHSRLEAIEGLAKAMELHDSPTLDHVRRMGAISAFLGERLGLDSEQVQTLRAAAPMHDIGKIGTSIGILRKAGPLTEDERAEMERHTVTGHEIFEDFESDLAQLAGVIAFTHHERYDGSGYPRGLVGEEIPLEGRIAAVADVFDALLSDRSYRPAMSVDEAIGEIEDGRGTQFDPRIVDVLLGNLDEALRIRA